MQKQAPLHPSPQKLSAGYAAFFYIPFLALLVFDVVSGYVLFIHAKLDFYNFFMMRIHTLSGFALFYLFIFLSFTHLKRLYSRRIIFATFLAAFSFYIMCALEAHPPSALTAFVVFNVILMWRYLLGSPSMQRAPVVIGVITWALFNLIFATGLAMGGPMKTFRSDIFNTVHKYAGVFFAPFLFYHLHLFRVKDGFTLKKAAAVSAILGINLWLYLPAMKQASRFQARRMEKTAAEKPGGYEPASKPGRKYSFQDAKTCGEVGCHSEIYKQWRASTHRFSASNMNYQKVFALFKEEAGKENAAFCEKCHNPDAVIFPEQSKHAPAREFFTAQGVSCLSCHLISENDVKTGNGFKSVKIDAPYLPGFHPKNKKEWKMLHYFISTDLRQHRKNYQRRPFYQKPEYCVTCHRVTVPAEVNGAKTFVFEGPYASWKKSRYAKEGITCQHCHMQLFEFRDPQSMEREMHARPDHRTFGLNASLPFYLPDALRSPQKKQLKEFSESTLSWLNGALRISSYEEWFLHYVRDGRAPAYNKYFKNKPVLGMRIAAEGGIRAGIPFTLLVETKNARAGHDFPVSLLDMVDVWLEVNITDAKGAVVFQSGILDKHSRLPKDARRLGAVYVDKDGNEINRHRVWRTAAIKSKRVIPPDGVISDRYEIKLAENAALPLAVKARWLYRRANPEFSRWLFDDAAKTFPVVPIASVEQTLLPE